MGRISQLTDVEEHEAAANDFSIFYFLLFIFFGNNQKQAHEKYDMVIDFDLCQYEKHNSK